MTDARVRLANPEDAPTIADIHTRSWRSTYRGLVPEVILEGLSVERRTAYWLDAITRQTRGHGADGPAASGRTWVVEAADGIVGFAASGPGRDESAPPPEGSGEVLAIYVAPDALGRGHGRVLFAQAVSDLRARGFDPIVVWVFEDNPVARRFYEAAGFRADGVRHSIDFDGLPIDEIRYRLDA
jgi:ribosomal protein S18 acetylase RimI-like enzyme